MHLKEYTQLVMRRCMQLMAMLVCLTIPCSIFFAAIAAASRTQPIYFLVSVIWEGEHVHPHNIEAIKRFREQFPEVRLLHFINPSYFSRKNVDNEALRTLMNQVIRPEDEIGMHLQPWKSFTDSAKIPFRYNPTYWGYPLDKADCEVDCGKEVPLMAYPKEDIAKLMQHGLSLMEQQQFGKIKSFLAGGWLASPDIWDAMSQNNLSYDFSAVPPSLLKKRLGAFPIFNWLNFRWNKITPFMQPYGIKTATGKVLQVGTSAVATDYLTIPDATQLFQSYLDYRRQKTDQILIYHISLHQETALQYVPRLTETLQQLVKMGETSNLPVQWLDLPLDTDRSDAFTGFSW